MADQLICGIKHIAESIGWSKNTILKRRQELKDAGVLIYMYRGRPPRLTGCAWESMLKIWMSKKAEKNETL